MALPGDVITSLTLISVLYIAAAGGLAEDPSLVVSTRIGRVRGRRSYIPSLGRDVDEFLGIPYAQAPLGELRFRHPLPVRPWRGVRNATALPASCYQKPDTEFGEFYGSTVWNSPTPVSEDCLYVNVFVPRRLGGRGGRSQTGGSAAAAAVTRRRRRRRMTVMVWIYGGGFYSGTSTLDVYDGKILAVLGDVIVVSIGYRVGALGFLSLGGNSEAPGNAGLYDQLMAMDWVQQNIEAFGGDRQTVTLFGESAGSVSVSLHLLSTLSHSKFHRAIMQSGSANMPWATTSQAEALRRSLELAFDYLHCPRTNNMSEVAACLRSQPASLIVHEQWVSRGIVQFPFLPVVDGVFLTRRPDVLLRRAQFKHCPIMLGSNRNEASFFLIYELTNNLGLHRMTMSREDYLDALSELFHYYPQYRPHHTLGSTAMDAIKFQYTYWLDPEDDEKNVHALDMATSDSQFLCPLNQFARRYAAVGLPVHAYYFTERYPSNPWPDWMGVLHGDEIFFVFGEPFKHRDNFTDSDRELSRQMITYWTNFAKTGDPNRQSASRRPTTTSSSSSAGTEAGPWPIHSPAGREYLELNSRYVGKSRSSGSVGRGPRINECAFWTEYLPDYINFTDTQAVWMTKPNRPSHNHETVNVREEKTADKMKEKMTLPSSGELTADCVSRSTPITTRHTMTIIVTVFVFLFYCVCTDNS